MNRLKIVIFLCILCLMLCVNEFTKYYYTDEKNNLQNNIVNDCKKNVKFINFNATWCYWSKKLVPTWTKLEEIAKNTNNLEVIDIKCDLEENQEICKLNGIEGYPTIKLFVDDKILDYNGDRSLDDMLNFIKINSD